MNVELLLRRQAKTLPLSWLAVVLALFLLWVVPSTASAHHQEEELSVAHYHRVTLGLLFHSEVRAWRAPGSPTWTWQTDYDRAALLWTLVLTIPVLVLGRSSWRRWQTAAAGHYVEPENPECL